MKRRNLQFKYGSKDYKKAYRQISVKEQPWLYKLYQARARCKNDSSYVCKKVKCLLSVKEMKALWIKYKASSMKCPSLDRINTIGNYTFKNCRFIEFSKNMKRVRSTRVKNISGFKGVRFHKDNGGWYEIAIWKNNKLHNFGTSKNRIEAAKIYNRNAKILLGKDAVLNKVEA